MQTALALVQLRYTSYALKDQYNYSKTSLFWRTTPDRSLATKQIPSTKRNKSRVTIYFCCNATSTYKLKLWIIRRYQRPRYFLAASVNID